MRVVIFKIVATRSVETCFFAGTSICKCVTRSGVDTFVISRNQSVQTRAPESDVGEPDAILE